MKIINPFTSSLLNIVSNPFYITRRNLDMNIKTISHKFNGKILDIGCGTMPYKTYFSNCEYIGLEIDTPAIKKSSNADVFYNGHKLPFKDNEFDSVVTFQVLEHVGDTKNFFGEINRVLKKDGLLLLTVPFIWDEHEQPNDFFRFISFGLKNILDKNGFNIIKHIKSTSGILAVFQLFILSIFKMSSINNRFLNAIKSIFVFFPITIAGYILPNNQDLFLDNIVIARNEKA